MNTSTNLERYSESTEHAHRYRAARHREDESHEGESLFHGLTIAISREAGTPGTSLARELGNRLGWLVYDHELVEKIAKDMGLRASAVDTVDEKKSSWLMESLAGLSSGPAITESGYVRHLVETIFSLGRKGKCVVVGRGAGYILPAATTLRVRLVGLLEDRVADVSHRLDLSREQAKRWVVDRERERIQFVKSHFSHDADDPHHYDLVLNTSRWTVAECADLVVQALRSFETHPAASKAVGVSATRA